MSRLLLMIALAASGLCAQDWVPTHIVAITEYPRLAWIAQVTGDVIIRCSLNKDGSVAKADVVSGPPLLGQQALQNAIIWKFQRDPPKKNQTQGFVTLTYQYRLEGGPKDAPHASFVVDLPGIIHVVAPIPVPMID
jgi:TonB family protein